jgi:hypothetical protein
MKIIETSNVHVYIQTNQSHCFFCFRSASYTVTSSVGGFIVTRVYLTVRFQRHIINILAIWSSANGYTYLAG